MLGRSLETLSLRMEADQMADDPAYAPVAFWPDAQHDMRYLGPAAERALTD